MTAPTLNCALFTNGDTQYLAVGEGEMALPVYNVGKIGHPYPPTRGQGGGYPACLKFMPEAVEDGPLRPMTWATVKARLGLSDAYHLIEDYPDWVGDDPASRLLDPHLPPAERKVPGPGQG